MKFFPVALTFVTGLVPGIVLAESIDQTPDVVNLNEELANAPYYDIMALPHMRSRGVTLIGEDGWAWAITSLRHEKKIRAQIVLERGKIVHEYYRKDEPINETRELAPGEYVSEHVHSVTKSFCAMIIAHMVEHPDYDIAFEDTLGKIFDDDSIWNSVLSSPNRNDNQTVAEYNVNEMKKATLNNILAMKAGLDDKRYRDRIIWYKKEKANLTIPLLQYLDSNYSRELKEFGAVVLAGKETWPEREEEVNWTPGGESLVDALAIYDMESTRLPKDPTGYGEFKYVAFSPLLSYIINATSGIMPSQYLEKYFMPYLGPGPLNKFVQHSTTPWADEIWGWKKNDDGMEYGWSGMNITARGLAKFGQLILQGGSNGNGTQILPKHWTDELISPNNPRKYQYHFIRYFTFIGYYPEVLCMNGYYGHIVCIHPKTQRIYVQLVEDDSECLYNENSPINKCGFGPKTNDELALRLFYIFSPDKHAFGAPQTALNPSPKTNKSEKVGKAKTGKTKKNKRELSE